MQKTSFFAAALFDRSFRLLLFSSVQQRQYLTQRKTTISFLATTRLITMKMVMAIGIAQEIVKMKMIKLHLNYLFSQQIIYDPHNN